jgi:hypothetical protein
LFGSNAPLSRSLCGELVFGAVFTAVQHSRNNTEHRKRWRLMMVQPGKNGELKTRPIQISRRQFLAATATATAIAATGVSNVGCAAEPLSMAEDAVKQLYGTLTHAQKKEVCFDWDHKDPSKGLLRRYVSANWRITKPAIASDFFTADQRRLIREVFEGIIHPDWHERIDKQQTDDAGGFGRRQSIAIIGDPGAGKFQCAITGRHLTVRCDGGSAKNLAFAGPIVYGHAAAGFTEKPDHPGNVFWHQAKEANELYQMLDGKQQTRALVKNAPVESRIAFRDSAERPGIPISDLTSDQKQRSQEVLRKLIEPYRQSDRDEVVACLKAQGGLDACHLAFFQEGDLGDDGVWDVWRIEGPAFVWHFRGSPHVHVWVHVAERA